MSNDRTSTYYGLFSDGNAWQNHRSSPYNRTPTHQGLFPVFSVGRRVTVISEHHMRPDKNIILNLHSFGQIGEGLNFYVVSDDHAVAYPNVAVNPAILPDDAIQNHRQVGLVDNRSPSE